MNNSSLFGQNLSFCTPSLVDGSNTAPAKNDDGVILKQNTGMFLYETYKDSVVSPICENTAMVAWRSSLRDFWSSSWTKTMYDKTNWDAIMVSYYGDTDYYHPHHDESVFTMLLWLWKEPKNSLVVICTFLMLIMLLNVGITVV